MSTDEPVDLTPPKPDPGAIFAGRSPDDVMLQLDGKPWWLTEAPTPRKRAPWPKSANYSAHRVKLAMTCLKKFQWRYRSHRADPRGPEAVTGKLVHGAYQDALLRRLGKREVPVKASVEELLFLLDHQAAQIATEDSVVQVLPGSLEEARKVVMTAGDHEFKDVFGAEVPFTVQVSRGFVLGGSIDRIDLIGLGAPELPDEVLVWDYKTTQETIEEENLWYEPQAGIYLVWARRRWPAARVIRFKLANLRQGENRVLRWTPSLDQFVLSYASTAFHLSSTGDSTATPGDHCRYCPYRDGDERHAPCEAYQDEVKKTRFTEKAAGGLQKRSLPELLIAYKGSADAEKLQEQAKKDYKTEILKRLDTQTSYKYGDLQAVVSRKRWTEFDMLWEFVHELAEVLQVQPKDVLRDFFRVKKEDLDTRVENLPPERSELAKKIVDNHQSIGLQDPSLAVRRTGAMF